MLAVTVATKQTDGYRRYVRSLNQFGIKHEVSLMIQIKCFGILCFFIGLIVKVYGMGEEWKGGNVDVEAGGGQKINILVRELEKFKNDDKKVILFTDRFELWKIQKMFSTS